MIYSVLLHNFFFIFIYFYGNKCQYHDLEVRLQRAYLLFIHNFVTILSVQHNNVKFLKAMFGFGGYGPQGPLQYAYGYKQDWWAKKIGKCYKFWKFHPFHLIFDLNKFQIKIFYIFSYYFIHKKLQFFT